MTGSMSKSARISYVILAVLLVLIGGLRMATLLLTVLFGYFALNFLSFGRSKLLGIALYLIAVASIGYGFIFFSRQEAAQQPTRPEIQGFAGQLAGTACQREPTDQRAP